MHWCSDGRKGRGVGQEADKEGPGMEEEGEEQKQLFLEKKKKTGKGKDPNGRAHQSWKPPHTRTEATQEETTWVKSTESRGLNVSPSGHSTAGFLLSSVKWVKSRSGFPHRVRNSPLPSTLAHKGLNVKEPVLPTSSSLRRLDLNFKLPWTALSGSSWFFSERRDMDTNMLADHP